MTTHHADSADLADVQDIYPLTPMQNGLLFHTLRAEQSGPYVEQFVFDLVGTLDVDLLAQAWTEVANRHTALRSAFVWEGVDEPLQVVVKSCRVPFDRHVLTGRGQDDVELVLARFLTDDRARGFTLAEAPLMRVTVFEHDRGAVVVWTLHHLIMDGWSMPITITEVAAVYRAAVEGTTADLAPVRPFRDFITWLRDQDQDKALGFWRQRLDGLVATDISRLRPGLPGERRGSAHAGRAYIDLSPELSDALVAAARTARVTLSSLFQAAWALLLARHADADEVVFGVAVAGRPTDLPDIEGTVGMFINTVPRRIRVDESASVAEWLREVLSGHLDSLPHQHVSLVDIQSCSPVPAGTPLFESIVVFENYPSENPDFPLGDDARLVVREVVEDAGYPMTLTVLPRKPSMRMQLLYDTAMFDAEVITTVLGRFETVLGALASGLDTPVEEVGVIGADTLRVLESWETRTLDRHGRPAPVGVPGRVELTADALAARAGLRYQDTGQMGVLHPDGTVEYISDTAPALPVVTQDRAEAGGSEDFFDRPLARLMRALWQEVLATRAVTEDTDFFKLGGDSLAAVRLIGRLSNSLRTSVVVGAVFADRTLRKLVDRVDADLGGRDVADARAAEALAAVR